MHQLVNSEKAYCFQKPGEIYAVYLPDSGNYTLDLEDAQGEFSLQWYDPLEGGEPLTSSVDTLQGGKVNELGTPPADLEKVSGQDWVLLVRKRE